MRTVPARSLGPGKGCSYWFEAWIHFLGFWVQGLALGHLMQASDAAFEELQGAAASVLDPTARTVLWPALGGLVTGMVALAYPEVLYQVGA